MQKKKMQTVEDIGIYLRMLMNKMALSRTKFSYAIKNKKTKLKSQKIN